MKVNIGPLFEILAKFVPLLVELQLDEFPLSNTIMNNNSICSNIWWETQNRQGNGKVGRQWFEAE